MEHDRDVETGGREQRRHERHGVQHAVKRLREERDAGCLVRVPEREPSAPQRFDDEAAQRLVQLSRVPNDQSPRAHEHERERRDDAHDRQRRPEKRAAAH